LKDKENLAGARRHGLFRC